MSECSVIMKAENIRRSFDRSGHARTSVVSRNGHMLIGPDPASLPTTLLLDFVHSPQTARLTLCCATWATSVPLNEHLNRVDINSRCCSENLRLAHGRNSSAIPETDIRHRFKPPRRVCHVSKYQARTLEWS